MSAAPSIPEGLPSGSPPAKSEALKSGPIPRDVEVLERRHRDRVHTERGDPRQAHRIDREERVSGPEGASGPGPRSAPGGEAGIGLDVRV